MLKGFIPTALRGLLRAEHRFIRERWILPGDLTFVRPPSDVVPRAVGDSGCPATAPPRLELLVPRSIRPAARMLVVLARAT